MTPARADRCLTGGLGLLLGLALLAASAATLAGCDEPSTSPSRWTLVTPPPWAPPGTKCGVWVSSGLVSDTRYGGPVCFEPNPPVCTAGPVDGGAR